MVAAASMQPVTPVVVYTATTSPTSIVSVPQVEITESVTLDAPEVYIDEVDDFIHNVPFYSQFTDITPVEWRKVGCGIASTAMLIDFYSSEKVDVDALLQQGINSNAYLDDAGWTHSGLINLSKSFGLDGASHSLTHLAMNSAFTELKQVVEEGPVMVSVHYTFQPTNPIPHLAVVTGIDDERVYYNDPAESAGQNSISIEQFQSAWKKRYIDIRPSV